MRIECAWCGASWTEHHACSLRRQIQGVSDTVRRYDRQLSSDAVRELVDRSRLARRRADLQRWLDLALRSSDDPAHGE